MLTTKDVSMESICNTRKHFLFSYNDANYDINEPKCMGCGLITDDEHFLICDNDKTIEIHGAHIYCLDPALKSIPNTDWFCPKCDKTKYISKSCIYCCSTMYQYDKKDLIQCSSKSQCKNISHSQCISFMNNNNINKISNWQCPQCLNEMNRTKLMRKNDTLMVIRKITIIPWMPEPFLSAIKANPTKILNENKITIDWDYQFKQLQNMLLPHLDSSNLDSNNSTQIIIYNEKIGDINNGQDLERSWNILNVGSILHFKEKLIYKTEEEIEAEIQELFENEEIEEMICKILSSKIQWIGSNIPKLICQQISAYAKMDIIFCESCSANYFFCDNKQEQLDETDCIWDNGWVNINGINGYDCGVLCEECWDDFTDRCEQCYFGDGDFIDADNYRCRKCKVMLCQAHHYDHEYECDVTSSSEESS